MQITPTSNPNPNLNPNKNPNGGVFQPDADVSPSGLSSQLPPLLDNRSHQTNANANANASDPDFPSVSGFDDNYVPPPPRVLQQQERLNQIVKIIQDWPGEYAPAYDELADYLNDQGILSPRGLPWKAAMLYNGLKYHGLYVSHISSKPARPHHNQFGDCPRDKSRASSFSISAARESKQEQKRREKEEFAERFKNIVRDYFASLREGELDLIAPKRHQKRPFPWIQVSIYVNDQLDTNIWSPNALYTFCHQNFIDYRALGGVEFSPNVDPAVTEDIASAKEKSE